MNFTYYYFCDCDYQYNQVVHVGEDEKVYQCLRCSTLEGKKSQDVYHIECIVCGGKEELGDTVTFQQLHACRHCGVKGKITMNDDQGFRMMVESKSSGSCQKCGRDDWQMVPEMVICPFCTRTLKVKMSNFWED